MTITRADAPSGRAAFCTGAHRLDALMPWRGGASLREVGHDDAANERPEKGRDLDPCRSRHRQTALTGNPSTFGKPVRVRPAGMRRAVSKGDQTKMPVPQVFVSKFSPFSSRWGSSFVPIFSNQSDRQVLRSPNPALPNRF